jgi:hypothetical protein
MHFSNLQSSSTSVMTNFPNLQSSSTSVMTNFPNLQSSSISVMSYFSNLKVYPARFWNKNGIFYYAKTLLLYRQLFVEFHKRPFQMKIWNEKINYYHDKITMPNYSA